MATFEFDKDTLRDALSRYDIGGDGTRRNVRDPDTYIRSMQSLYERVHGVQLTDDFGDLLWLTPENMQAPQQSARLNYLYESSKGNSQHHHR